MTEERITRTTDEAGNTHTTHTVVSDGANSSSSGFRWGLLLLLAVIAIGAFVIFSQMSDAEIARDEAIADAAGDVSEAAGEVGEAAQDAGEAIGDALESE